MLEQNKSMKEHLKQINEKIVSTNEGTKEDLRQTINENNKQMEEKVNEKFDMNDESLRQIKEDNKQTNEKIDLSLIHI